MKIDIVPFEKGRHNRKGFDCGILELNQYLLEKASQDVRNHYADVFVAPDPETNKILGYYTLSNAAVPFQNVPEEQRKKLPRYSQIPAILLGRLAVDKSMQGIGLGMKLMADAITKSLNFSLSWAVMAVDAKDDAGCAFYRKFKFAPLLGNSLHLYARRGELENLVASELNYDHDVSQQEIEEVKIAVPSKIKEDWKTVASAKGQTLEDFLITSSNDAAGKFFEERNATKREAEKEQSTPLPLLERLKNHGR